MKDFFFHSTLWLTLTILPGFVIAQPMANHGPKGVPTALILPSKSLNCGDIVFSLQVINNGSGCCYRLKADNANPDNCYMNIGLTLDVGEFANFAPLAGWQYNSGGPAEYTVRPSVGFIPPGLNMIAEFCLEGAPSSTLTLQWSDFCSMEGCTADFVVNGCYDPEDASIIGVKYRECGSLPYSNQATIPGWMVQLLDAMDNVIDEQLTDANGNYAFYDLAAGTYVVKEVQQSGWTPNFPLSGKSTVVLSPSEQEERDFGNCPACSCDSIYAEVTQLEGSSDTSTYFLSISNASPYCFEHVDIELDSAQLLNWQVLLPNWEVEQLGPNLLRLTSTGPFLPGSGMIPLSFQASGVGNHHIDVVTTANNGGNSQECRWTYVYQNPITPILRSCCPANSFPGPEIFNDPGFNAGTTFFTWAAAQYTQGVVNSPGHVTVTNGTNIASNNPVFQCVGKSGSPSDYFLLVDASTALSAYVWEQQHTLTNNKFYTFCAYFKNVVRPGSNLVNPVVIMEILTASNVVVASSAPTTLVEGASWLNVSVSYTPINSGTYKFRIRPVGTAHFGNDFAIDCASLTACSFIPTLVCACPSGGASQSNLIANGDFSQGPTGFTTTLAGPSGCGAGRYNVLGSLQAFCPPGWPSLPARSAPWMLCLDGFDTGGPDVLWQSPVTLAPNSNYCFSFYWTPTFGPSGPNAQNIPFDIQIVNAAGIPVPGFTPITASDNLSANPGAWYPKSYNWSTGPGGSYFIAIRQLTGTPQRDFGIDDICMTIIPPVCTADFNEAYVNCGFVNFQGFANGTPNYTYCWDFDGNLNTCESNVQNPSYQFTPGLHVITLKITDATGCMATYFSTLNIPNYPTSVTVTGNPGLNICTGQSTTLTAGGGNWLSCQWSLGSGNSITVNTPGTYCVTCTDANMCTATGCATVTQSPLPTVSIQNPPSLCVGATGSFTAIFTSGSTLVWQPSGATSTSIPINTSTPGAYGVLVTATLNGCTASATATVVITQPNANAGLDKTVCQWQTPTLTATGGGTYAWSPNGTTTNPYTLPPMQVSNTYTVTVTNAAGCTATDQVNITVIDCSCFGQNTLVQNGGFSQGFPCIGTDEDICNAGFWCGAWPDYANGISVGDFYNTGPCTPTAAYGSLATPVPFSYGGFGGLWCNPHQSQVVWREAILNTLSTPIPANSGNYAFSMRMACLTNVSNGTPRLSVYGVPVGANMTVTGIGPNILTATTPLNAALFDINGTGAVLLGKIFVPNTCNNNFTNAGFTFNANQLPSQGINRIFLTRDDPIGNQQNPNIGGTTYLAVDSICIEPVLDSTLCDCGPLNFAYFWQHQTNWIQPIGHNQPTLAVPCPVQGANYEVYGEFHCAPDQCGNNTIDWKLDRPGNLTDLTGQSNTPYPFFTQIFSPADCPQSGNYQLTITRHCGNKDCSKIFNFKLENCPCDCDSIKRDVGYGFSVSSVYFPPNQCRKKLRPLSLCVNDVVIWNISGVGTFTTTGNTPLLVNFPTSGTYYICMHVQRTEPNGTVCKWESCREVIVNCGIPPVEPATVFCPNPTVRNSGFTEGMTPGLLNQWGTLTDWEWAPNPGDGLVFVEDSSGSFDEGHVVLRGRQGNFAGIMQEINLTLDSFMVINFEVNNYQGTDLPTGTRIEVRLQELPYLYPDLQKQVLLSKAVVDSSGWHNMGTIWKIDLDTSLHYLVICLQNDDPTHNSVVGIDNFEICSWPADGTLINVPEIVHQQSPMRIYPNPNTGTFTLAMPNAATADMSLRIVDLAGRLLQVQQTDAGSKQQIVQASLLPNGLYFLQVLWDGKVLAVEKFVKQ